MKLAILHDMPCPVAGTGVHSWLMGAANRCRNHGLPLPEAVSLLRAESASCGREVTDKEILETVQKCYAEAGVIPLADGKSYAVEKTVVIPRGLRPKDVQFDPQKLSALAAKLPGVDDAWFAARSPVPIDDVTAATFLQHLYLPDEKVLIFDRFDAKQPASTVTLESDPCDPACLSRFHQGHAGGIWFLANPVDGHWHPKDDGETSCRNWRSVTSFRFVVLESDTADPGQWLSALAQFPIPIAAIYTSGGRSIHALWQLNAASKDEWDAAIFKHKPPLKIIGADPGSLSAVRLSRLPQCERAEKSALQKLLFLNPQPTPGPLADLPPLR